MNEPKDTAQSVVHAAYQAAINAIRATGAKQAIHIEGNGWGNYKDYAQNCWYGDECNTAMFLRLFDPENNLILHSHNYYTGTDTIDCSNPNKHAEEAAPLTAWARANNQKLFAGEFFWPDDVPACVTASRNALQYLEDNKDVWLGWTYWAAGSEWPEEAKAINDIDDPQVPVLLDYIGD
jgi:endoglucanase